MAPSSVTPSQEQTGRRATPIVTLERDGQTIGIAMRYFWENFPKAIEAGPQSLTLRLFPRQYADLHELQGGEQKTHEFVVAFGKDTVFVPGHGQVCGQEGIALEGEVMDDLAEHAQKMAKTGVSVEEAQRRYTVPEKFKSLGIFAWSYSIDNAVTQFYAAAKAGKL